MPKISIIIPCRDEADTLWFTLNSLQMHTQSTSLRPDDLEIIVADNDPRARGCGKSVQEVVRDASFTFPVHFVDAGASQSPYYPRMRGADAAKGDILVFLDAHVLLSPHTIDAMLQYFEGRDELCMAHIPVGFGSPARLFGPYKLRLKEDFWGAWTPLSALGAPTGIVNNWIGEQPIAASGIWCYGTTRASWERVRGFNQNFRGYAGGEVYLQLKYWLLGGRVTMLRSPKAQAVEPLIYGVHWSAPRRYAAKWEERIRNVLLGVSVVAPELLENVKRTLWQKSLLPESTVKKIFDGALESGAEEAAWMKAERKFADVHQLAAHWGENGVYF